mmetsp:Transcript_8565/g.19838  ORF Transcript_8565/g.19838 Transcript_8565/m.19838 type:complete len:211 (-) Transcript_8565:880-1512(-)
MTTLDLQFRTPLENHDRVRFMVFITISYRRSKCCAISKMANFWNMPMYTAICMEPPGKAFEISNYRESAACWISTCRGCETSRVWNIRANCNPSTSSLRHHPWTFSSNDLPTEAPKQRNPCHDERPMRVQKWSMDSNPEILIVQWSMSTWNKHALTFVRLLKGYTDEHVYLHRVACPFVDTKVGMTRFFFFLGSRTATGRGSSVSEFVSN